MKNELELQFALLQSIRDFFKSEGFIDVMTPPMVRNPGMETHIHPFEVYGARDSKSRGFYLHTSPEFHMKELLSLGFQNIFNISYCFRDEPISPIHRPQFLMLEWYRTGARYEKIMDDTEALIRWCGNDLSLKNVPKKFERLTISELFLHYLKFDILDFLDKELLKKKIEKDYPEVPLPLSECSWDDYYFLLFLNKIEPKLVNHPYLLLYEFPAPLAALSTLKSSDPRVCERFEVYLNGIELCNAFNELTNLEEQKKRFNLQKKEKNDLYGYSLPEASVLYEAMERGFPKSSGIALGVERLLKSLTKIENPFYPFK